MKMSEIFDLPVTSDDLYEIFVHYGTTKDQDEAVSNVINHADALADALDNVIETLELYGAHDDPYYRIAIDELKKYRGCSDE